MHNNTIARLTHFRSTLKPVIVKCLVCQYRWIVKRAHSLISKDSRGCAKCHQVLIMLPSEFDEKLNALYNNEIVRTGKFYGSNKRVSLRCNICGHTWDTKGTHILNKKKYGCRVCRYEGFRIKEDIYPCHHDKFDDVLERVFGEDLTRVGVYKSTSLPVQVKCNKCGNIFEISLSNLMCNPVGCLKCGY